MGKKGITDRIFGNKYVMFIFGLILSIFSLNYIIAVIYDPSLLFEVKNRSIGILSFILSIVIVIITIFIAITIIRDILYGIEQKRILKEYDWVCPRCSTGNYNDTKVCKDCGLNLDDALAFIEDDDDYEITDSTLTRYPTKFWSKERTGKKEEYLIKKMEDVNVNYENQSINFKYSENPVTFRLDMKNLDKMKELLESLGVKVE